MIRSDRDNFRGEYGVDRDPSFTQESIVRGSELEAARAYVVRLLCDIDAARAIVNSLGDDSEHVIVIAYEIARTQYDHAAYMLKLLGLQHIISEALLLHNASSVPSE